MEAFNVLADMRKALVSDYAMTVCENDPDISEEDSSVDLREAGSNYAVITYITSTPILTGGRNG